MLYVCMLCSIVSCKQWGGKFYLCPCSEDDTLAQDVCCVVYCKISDFLINFSYISVYSLMTVVQSISEIGFCEQHYQTEWYIFQWQSFSRRMTCLLFVCRPWLVRCRRRRWKRKGGDRSSWKRTLRRSTLRIMEVGRAPQDHVSVFVLVFIDNM